MDMEIAREDWLLIFIGLAIVLPMAYSFMSPSSFTPETEIEQYCVDVAADVADASKATVRAHRDTLEEQVA